MLRNKIVKELKHLMVDDEVNNVVIGNKMGVTRQYISKLQHNPCPIQAGFVDMMENMGYDLEIKYIKRGENEGA